MHKQDYCKVVLSENVDFSEVREIRLYLLVIEECFEIVSGMSLPADDLWNWGKKEWGMIPKSKMFGNLYEKAIAAASHVGEPIRYNMEKEYAEWKHKVGLS